MEEINLSELWSICNGYGTDKYQPPYVLPNGDIIMKKVDYTELPPGYTVERPNYGGYNFFDETGRLIVWNEFDTVSIRTLCWADYKFSHKDEDHTDAHEA